jgi:hypothetical protein
VKEERKGRSPTKSPAKGNKNAGSKDDDEKDKKIRKKKDQTLPKGKSGAYIQFTTE